MLPSWLLLRIEPCSNKKKKLICCKSVRVFITHYGDTFLFSNSKKRFLFIMFCCKKKCSKNTLCTYVGFLELCSAYKKITFRGLFVTNSSSRAWFNENLICFSLWIYWFLCICWNGVSLHIQKYREKLYCTSPEAFQHVGNFTVNTSI